MSAAEDQGRLTQATQFFDELYREKECGLISLWQRVGRRSHWLEDPRAAATLAVEFGYDVFTGVGLSPEDFGPRRRCPSDRVIAVPGFWADIDVACPVHKKSDLPPTEEAARELIKATGLPPTLLVHSGHGLQVWWLLQEMARFRNDQARERFAELSAGWQSYLREIARQFGWVIDQVGDLARLLRVPGTVNGKTRSRPCPVRLLVSDGPRYEDLAEFEERVAPLARSVQGAVVSSQDLDLGELHEHRAPPADLIERLCRTDGAFRDVWEHQRSDLPSESEYEMSIAGHLVRSGFSDRLIVDAIIAHRRRWDPESTDKVLRRDYLEGTIRRARTTASPDGPDRSDDRVGVLGEGKATAEILLRIVDEECTLFHDNEKIGYAEISVDNHVEVCLVRSRAFRLWLGGRFYSTQNKAASKEGVRNVVETIEARAIYDGRHAEVHVRVAHQDERIYVDLANDNWQVAEISPDRYRVLDKSPVKFRRPRGMLALPLPEQGGDIAELRTFLNLQSDDTWYLVLAFMTFSFCQGPYPVLSLGGEQGSSKSTTARVIRLLVDPNKAPLRAEPRDERDLVIASSNSWLLVIDNVSRLPRWLSDALCRLSTGGGFSTRELYENSEEVLFDVKRPCTITAIESVITNSDLLDRAILITLPTIREADRREEGDFWRDFDLMRPRFFGALLDCVSKTLRELPSVRLTSRPRMADFARWGVALERALAWPSGSFLQAYVENRQEATAVTLESSPVGGALLGFLKDKTQWAGTAKRLLEALEQQASENARRGQNFPRHARGLAGAVRRLCPALRTMGIEVTFHRASDSSRERQILIQKTPAEPSERSIPSGELRTQQLTSDGSDDCGRRAITDRPASRPGNEGVSDGSDGPDGRPRALSARPPRSDDGEALL